MTGSDPCDAVLALVGTHWMSEAALVRATGAAPQAIRRCLEAAVAQGTLETPRGVYRSTMWRRAVDHHSS